MALLEAIDLKVHYPVKGGILGRTVGYVKAVDGISFSVESGQTLGIVGESGSGKSTAAKAIMGLAEIKSGQILFEGNDITYTLKKNRSLYHKNVQMIFQDVQSSLNPRKRVFDIIAEPLRNFEKLTKAQLEKRIDELLAIVGLTPENAKKYPFEFSGGQRQRIGVARAVALKPKLIVADEPVSALDLSVQAQVLNYMKDIQEEMGLAYIFISHDLGVVRHTCQNLVIMHNSRFVEAGTRNDVFDNPQHIYTKRLIAAIPDKDPRKRDENDKIRKAAADEYDSRRNEHYDGGSRVFDLINISETHRVALPEGVL